MKHLYALIIKFAMVAIILELILSLLTNLTFTEILYVSATVTILAYIVGDLIILAASNNTIATITDAGLALLTIYMFRNLWNNTGISFTDSLIAAVVIGLGEWFFHKFVARRVFPNRDEA